MGSSAAIRRARHSLSCSVVAKSASSLERDYWYTVSRRPEDLESPESVGEESARRALARLDARQISTRVVPVIYPPELARGLFGHLVGAIRGTAQYRRATFLAGAAGKQVLSSLVDITEDPLIPRAPRQRALRRRRRRDEAPRARQVGRAAGLRAVQLLRAPPRHADNRQCGRRRTICSCGRRPVRSRS